MKIVRLTGSCGRSSRIFHEWIESQNIIALSNEREIVMTTTGPKQMSNCAVFPASIAERVAKEFNEWIAKRDTVTIEKIVRTPDEWRQGLPASRRKEVKMFVGGVHKPKAFTQNWK